MEITQKTKTKTSGHSWDMQNKFEKKKGVPWNSGGLVSFSQGANTLPETMFSCDLLPTSPIVAKQLDGTLRISPEGSFKDVKPSSCAIT